ncbi:MAG: class I SAM-dependent methyltransferase [Acidobacteria bacterium]|nr:class I SAM-dependent methyltransferase [Acidobacteriota bacterium]
MSDQRTQAYLYDLYVAPLWRERFDQLFIEQVGLPTEGQMLLLECGTGGLALEVAAALKDTGTVVASDQDQDILELARAKALATKLENVRFVSSGEIQTEFTPHTYDLTLGDTSLLPPNQIQPMLNNLYRPLATDGTAILYAITRGSFDEFFSIYWEALFECGLAEQLQPQLEQVLNLYPTLEDIEGWATSAGWKNVQVVLENEEFTFDTGEEFLSSPLISNYQLENWLAIVPTAAEITQVKQAIAAIIDRDRGEYPFDITIKAALVTGKRNT